MRKSLHLLLAFVLITLASSLGQIAPDIGLIPNVAIPVVVYIALSHPLSLSLFGALVIGYMLDRFCMAPTGFHMSLLAWATVGIRLLTSMFNLEGMRIGLIVAFFTQGALTLLGYLLLKSSTGHAALSSTWAVIQLPAMLVCSLLVLVTWPLQKWIDKPRQETNLNLLRGG